MNDKDKLIKKIIGIEERIWIPSSVSKKDDFADFDMDKLKKYNRAVEIVLENTSKETPQYVKCSQCGKYMANIEIKAHGTCFDCQDKKWF